MAQLFCTGPVHIFVGVGDGNAAAYFGTTETNPEIDIEPSIIPVQNDLGGNTPIDGLYSGRKGTVRGTFTRWTQDILDRMRRTNSQSGTAGQDVSGDIGSLLVTEGLAYKLWLLFPYSTKLAMAPMTPGFRFLAAYLHRDSIPSMGTKPKKVSLLWECYRVYKSPGEDDIGNAAGQPAGSFTLYDEDMTGLPPIE